MYLTGELICECVKSQVVVTAVIYLETKCQQLKKGVTGRACICAWVHASVITTYMHWEQRREKRPVCAHGVCECMHERFNNNKLPGCMFACTYTSSCSQ